MPNITENPNQTEYRLKTTYMISNTRDQETEMPFSETKVKIELKIPVKDFVKEYCNEFGIVSEDGLEILSYDSNEGSAYTAVFGELIRLENIRDRFIDSVSLN